MRKTPFVAAAAAVLLGASLGAAGSMPVTSVSKVVKADPRGDKGIKWTKAAENDYVRLMVGQVKEWGYHSHANETHLIVVMQGRGVAMVEGQMMDVKPGDILTFAASSKHSLEQKGSEPLVILATWSAQFDPSKDTTKHEMHGDHASHGMHHPVAPAAATQK